ncbi:hypothetical protein D3C77_443450 [compost metagenome]
MLEPDLARGVVAVGDPARVQQPGGQHVLDHVAADVRRLVATVPDQPQVVGGRLQAADAHVADQFLVGRDAADGFAQGRAVHGDVAEHAPRAGLDEAPGMQAEQRIA